MIAHLYFLKWSITAAHCCWEWWLAPTMEIWLPTEICSINWSEVAKDKGELLPSTWLLLLLQILTESSFLFSTSLKNICMVCGDCHFSCSISCCYCCILSQQWFPTPPETPLPALRWQQSFSSELVPRMVGSWVLLWLSKVTGTILKHFVLVPLYLESWAHPQSEPGCTEQTTEGCSFGPSLSAAHSNFVPRSP